MHRGTDASYLSRENSDYNTITCILPSSACLCAFVIIIIITIQVFMYIISKKNCLNLDTSNDNE